VRGTVPRTAARCPRRRDEAGPGGRPSSPGAHRAGARRARL